MTGKNAHMARNIYEDNKSKGLRQENDGEYAEKIAKRNEIRRSVSQLIFSKNRLELPGGIIATGGTAILAIVVIFLAYYLYLSLSS